MSRQDARLNLTDVYVFPGQTGTVFVMNMNTSLAGEGRSAGFHPEARYEFKIHLDNQRYETITYRFSFGERNGDGAQTVSTHQLTGADARDDGADGSLIASGRTGEIVEGADNNGIRLWAGAASDPFYLDLRHLSFIIEGLQTKTPIEYIDWTESQASNSFADSWIYSIVLEVPGTDAQLRPGRDIGVWSTAKLATDAGGWRQINRAAIPMMWPLFRAIGDADDSDYASGTASHPADDRANDGTRVAEMITAATRIIGAAEPGAYGDAVSQRLLPDLLPYKVGTPATFGFAGFNGRTLADNAPEVMYSLVTNTGFATGFTSAVAATTRSDEFPYVVPSTQDA